MRKMKAESFAELVRMEGRLQPAPPHIVTTARVR